MAPHLVSLVPFVTVLRDPPADTDADGAQPAGAGGAGAIGAKVQESLSGIHVVKAYTLHEREAEEFRRRNDSYNEEGLALARLRGALMPLIRGTYATSMMMVLVYGSYLVTRNQMSIGGLVAFMGYLAQLMWPTTALGWVISIYQRGRASMKRLDDIFLAPVRPRSTAARRGWKSWRNRMGTRFVQLFRP